MNRRTIITIAVVLAVIFIAFSFYSLARQRVANPRLTPTPIPTPRPVTLLDYLDSDDVQVQFSIDGRIVAKESHISQTITVAKTRRDMDIFKDYLGIPDPHQSYDNNQPAFEDFMRALQNAGFVHSVTNPKAGKTEVGLCPFGQRYVYELIKNGETLFRGWSTTCGDPTTFAGEPSTIRTLFQVQIPDYPKISKL